MLERIFETAKTVYSDQLNVELLLGDDIRIITSTNDPFHEHATSNNVEYIDLVSEAMPTKGGREFITSPYTGEQGFVHDLNFVFTGLEFQQTAVVGLARGATLYNIPVDSSDGSNATGIVTRYWRCLSCIERSEMSESELEATFIHEVGHLFGGGHGQCSREDREDPENRTPTTTIMCQGQTSTPGIFSPVAKDYIMSLLETYHNDAAHTGNAEPLENSDSQLFADKAHYTSGDMIINDVDINVFSFVPQISLSTLLLRSADAIKISGGVKLKGSSGQIIMQGSYAELNDYCSSNALSFRFASLKADERDILKTPKTPESQIERVRLFPNPAANLLNIDITLTEKSLVSAAVYSLSGKLMFNLLKNNELSEGDHQKQFDVSKLALGHYIIKIDTEKGSKSYQIIKE